MSERTQDTDALSASCRKINAALIRQRPKRYAWLAKRRTSAAAELLTSDDFWPRSPQSFLSYWRRFTRRMRPST